MIEETLNNLEVGIVTSPFLTEAGSPPLCNLVAVLSHISKHIYIITGCSGSSIHSEESFISTFFLEKNQESKIVFKIIKFIKDNIIIIKLIHSKYDCSTWLFFIGEQMLLFPIIASKILGKKTIFVASSSMINLRRLSLDDLLFQITYSLVDTIVISSKRLDKKRASY